MSNAEDKAHLAFERGLSPRGGPQAKPSSENLIQSVNESSLQARSAYVQSSERFDVGMHYATGERGGLLYTAENRPDSIVVNRSSVAPQIAFPEQSVVAHPGGISAQQIHRADLVNKSGELIESYINVRYWR